jgi:hypothetical protein
MKRNPWTTVLLSAGLISLPSVLRAEEKPNSVLTAVSPTTISGYVDTSAQINNGGTANLPPYAFGGPSKANGFNLNVAQISLEKPISAEEAWSAGYKVDLIFGPDANSLATTSSGTVNATSDFGIRQAYVAMRAPVGNGLDFKLGVWDTVIGYESFSSGNDPNFTRSYGYTIEPTTHTGLQGSYTFCEYFSMNFGVADSYGPTINGRSSPPDNPWSLTWLGSMTFTAPKEWGFLAGSTLTAGAINGYNAGIAADATSWYVGTSLMTPLQGLRVGAALDVLNNQDLSGETWTVGGYASYQATEKLSFHARGEYLRDRGAQKYFVKTLYEIPGDTTSPSTTEILAPDAVLALTATVQYDLWKNVLSRLEFRWDHALTGPDVWGGTATPTFDNPQTGNQKNAIVFLANIVYKF